MKFILIVSLNILLTFSLTMTAASAEGFSDKKNVKIFIKQMVKKHKFNKQHLEKLFSRAKIYDSIL